jgi:AcrR family transcriptional regulator
MQLGDIAQRGGEAGRMPRGVLMTPGARPAELRRVMSDSGARREPIPDGLRERKKRQTKRRIAHQAASLFRLRGYDNVRMSEIAARVWVYEQTLYNYFPTKEHLIFDLDGEYEERIVAIISPVRSQCS